MLPADAEPFIPKGGDISDLRNPGCYALELSRPHDVGERWDQHFDNRPDYWDEFVNADRVLYVGASKDVLGRLEDHRDGEKRKAALLRVCSIASLFGIEWFPSAAEAFEREHGRALALNNAMANTTWVHQR